MTKERQDRFILELPLKTEPWQRSKLGKIFKVTNHIKNWLIAKELRNLKQLERTKAWRENEEMIRTLYPVANMELSSPGKDASFKEKEKYKKALLKKKEAEKKLKPYYEKKRAMLSEFGFSAFDFTKEVKDIRNHYKALIGAQVGQKIAKSVWPAFEKYFYGNGEEIHFSKLEELSTEGATNETGIVYKEGFVCLSGMKLKLSGKRNQYELDALTHEICYCRIIRKMHKKGWQYYVQLVLKGSPPVKVDKDGCIKHYIGEGRVGLDIGPQTLAVASDVLVSMHIFCEKVQSIEDELGKVNKAMERSRRAMNPEFFNTDGTIIPRDKLPSELLDKRGKRLWKESKRYKELKHKRKYLYQMQKEYRIQSHRQLANSLLPLGDTFYIEDMNFRALAKRSKKTERSEKESVIKTKTGEEKTIRKFKRKKRFGKSIANKAPATFVKTLEYALSKAGGRLIKINTREAKASQYKHDAKIYKKKKLCDRWNLIYGEKVQRDLYSAFLIQHSNDTLDGFVQELLDEKYESFKTMHDEEVEKLMQKELLPSSIGIETKVS